MKVAAVLTSHVMDAISHLPGVATLDWCDRAAGALSRLHHPCVVCVTLGRLDSRGFITALELVGAAASDPAMRVTIDESTGRSVIGGGDLPAAAGPTDVEQLVSGVKLGEWIGWNIGHLSEGLWFVATASQQGLLGSRGPSPLSKRWEWLNASEILLGAVSIPGQQSGRMLMIEIASADPQLRDSVRQHAVLAATLPMLRQRLANAFGTTEDDKHRWLTPREELVLWHLVAGKKVPQIAAELHRSVYTVHDHVKSLHRKLNASNRGQLVARALGHLGPLSPDDKLIVKASASAGSSGVGHAAPSSTPGATGADAGGANGHADDARRRAAKPLKR